MPASPLFIILHLSDFHFSRRKQTEQGIIVDALITDLETICIGHRRADIVAFIRGRTFEGKAEELALAERVNAAAREHYRAVEEEEERRAARIAAHPVPAVRAP